MSTLVDFEVSDTGSFGLFEPLTLDALDFAREVFAEAQTWGTSFVVERGYCLEIIFDLVNQQGFIVSVDGRIIDSIEEV